MFTFVYHMSGNFSSNCLECQGNVREFCFENLVGTLLVWLHGAQDVGATAICDVTCRREEDVGRMSKHDVGWTSQLDVGPTVRDS